MWDAAASPSGRIAYYEHIGDKYDALRIVVMSAEGGRGSVLRVAARGARHSQSPAWSPDATRIAFVTFSDAGTGGTGLQVWVMNADGSAQRRLTRNGYEPAWSPDGRNIAFGRADDIYIMSRDGSGKRRLTRNGSAPTWSPDGRQIAFVRAVAPRCYRRNGDKPRCTNSLEIYVMNADGTVQRRLTQNRFSEYNPDWSPTGTKIAYDRSRERADVVSDSWVFLMNVDGSSQRRLTSRGRDYNPSWSPDATKIVFDRATSIVAINADGSGQRNLYSECQECGEPDWSSR